jgi:hypothetical protein
MLSSRRNMGKKLWRKEETGINGWSWLLTHTKLENEVVKKNDEV